MGWLLYCYTILTKKSDNPCNGGYSVAQIIEDWKHGCLVVEGELNEVSWWFQSFCPYRPTKAYITSGH